MEFKESFLIHLENKTNEINSKTLSTSLICLETLFEKINDELKTGKRIELRIKPFEVGSFDVPFDLIEATIVGILAVTNVSNIQNIMKILIELIKFKLSLKEEHPDKINSKNETVEIVTKNGNTFYIDKRTYNLYQNPTINQVLDSNFKSLSEDKDVKSYVLKDSKQKELIKIARKDFGLLTKEPYVEEVDIEKEKQIEEIVHLNVFKIVFDTRYNWEFYYKDSKISAKIKDESFIKKIASGESFAKGDILKVKIYINQVFDKVLNIFINKSYEIVEVIEHIPKHRQFDLGY